MNNQQVQDACTFIRAYHFKSASDSFFSTEDQQVHDLTERIMNDLCEISPISILIKKNDWGELFKNERWLGFLQGALNYSAMDNKLTYPLKVLSEAFPLETEYYIIPSLLRN